MRSIFPYVATYDTNEDIICHSEDLENKSDQKKQGSCTAIRLEYKMTDEQTTKVS